MADELEVRYLGDVQRLNLAPEDIVVLKTALRLPTEQAARLRACMQDLLGIDRKIIILSDGLEIGVLSPTCENAEA